MTTEIAVKEAPSIFNAMAERYGMDRVAFIATLKATVVPAATSNEQLAAFLLVAKQYSLNPITKEIYAFPAKGGGIQPIVGIDGWCNIINSNPALDGIEFQDVFEVSDPWPEIEAALKTSTDHEILRAIWKKHESINNKKTPIAITCRIYRKDRSKPIECTEYLSECKKESEPWKKWPARMLRHKALIQCARYAFSLSGIVDPDEAERMVDITPEVTDPTTGEIMRAQPSPFKTGKQRKEFYDMVSKAYEKSENIDNLNACATLFKPKLDALTISRDDNDHFTLEGIETLYRMAENRLRVIDHTPIEDTHDFTEEEIEQQKTDGLRERD